jgi:hypothetical protein
MGTGTGRRSNEMTEKLKPPEGYTVKKAPNPHGSPDDPVLWALYDDTGDEVDTFYTYEEAVEYGWRFQ